MLKFCYNEKNYIYSDSPHNLILYNKGLQKQYKYFIRGIIDNNILYLRVYYPFNDIDNLTSEKLYQFSYELLKDSIQGILKAIKKHHKLNIKDIHYNVDRQYLENAGLYNL